MLKLIRIGLACCFAVVCRPELANAGGELPSGARYPSCKALLIEAAEFFFPGDPTFLVIDRHQDKFNETTAYYADVVLGGTEPKEFTDVRAFLVDALPLDQTRLFRLTNWSIEKEINSRLSGLLSSEEFRRMLSAGARSPNGVALVVSNPGSTIDGQIQRALRDSEVLRKTPRVLLAESIPGGIDPVFLQQVSVVQLFDVDSLWADELQIEQGSEEDIFKLNSTTVDRPGTRYAEVNTTRIVILGMSDASTDCVFFPWLYDALLHLKRTSPNRTVEVVFPPHLNGPLSDDNFRENLTLLSKALAYGDPSGKRLDIVLRAADLYDLGPAPR